MVERVAFRGRTPTQLVGLKDEEYIKMINSRERRSIKRKGLDYRNLIEKVEKHAKSNSTKPIRTHIREAVILPSWVGMSFEVYTGKEYKKIVINAAMLGHRLGEFGFTTKRVIHSSPGIKATRGSKFLAVK